MSLIDVTEQKKYKQYLWLAVGVCVYDLMKLNPNALKMMADVSLFCQKNKVKCVVTSIYRPPNDGISKSSTHQSYRAFDVSLRTAHGWNQNKIRSFKDFIEKNYKNVGAISRASGESRPIYVHQNSTNSGYHAHLQVRPIK